MSEYSEQGCACGEEGMKLNQSGILVLLVWGLTGCASWLPKSESHLRDSALSNLNPAPESMRIPAMAEGHEQIDPVYLRSQADYYFTMGEAYALEGKTQPAIDAFKLTLVYDPDAVLVRLRLASEYVRLGLFSEAVEEAEAATQKDPKNLEARMLLGGLYSALKMYEPAMEQYRVVAKISPQHVDAGIFIGALLAEQKNYEESIQHFESYFKSLPAEERAKAQYYIGRIQAERGEAKFAKSAERAFVRALSLKPDFTEAVITYSVFLKDSDRSKEAIQLLESYQRKSGPDREVSKLLSRYFLEKEDFPKAFEQLEILESFERDNLNVKVQLALILIEQERFKEAAVRLEDILNVAPELDKIRYYLGAVYEQMESYTLATQHFAAVPPESSYYADAVIQSAYIFKQAGKHRSALDLIKNAISQRDDVPQLYAFYASLLDDLKDFQTGVKMLSQAVEKFPTHTQLRFFYGSMQDRVGNSKESIAQMKKVLEIDEDHVQAMNYLAYTYAELNENLDIAEALARKAIKLQPEDGYILDTMGWILFKQGQNVEAIKYLEAAHRLKSDEAVIAEHLGDAYYRHQMTDKALEMYKKALEKEEDKSKSEKIQQKIVSIDKQRGSPSPASRLPASTAGP